MTQSPLPDYGPATYGAAFADVYDAWYGDITDIDATTDALAKLADGGAILELGVGTGRLALPLAARGLEVTGLDASEAMLAQLATKSGADSISTVLADMTDLNETAPPLPGEFALIFAAFNTFFNVTTEAGQRRCVASSAQQLKQGGCLVIEGFVPPAEGLASGGVSTRSITIDTVVLTASRHDPEAQQIVGQHIDISNDGIRLRPWALRYATPDQLDEMAADAGLVSVGRWSDWDGTPWASPAETQISVYRKN